MDLATAVTAVRTAVDRLSRVDAEAADATGLRTQLSELKTTQSRLDAQLARLTHQADASGAWIGTGARDTAEWLAKKTGTSSHRNRAAASLGEAMAKSGQLNEAVVSGQMSADKANAAVGAAGDRPLDDDIVSQIADLPLNGVRPATEAWRARLDADHDHDIARTQRARRFLRLTGQADGMTRVEGLLDPESAAVVRATLDSLMSESAFDTSGRTREQRCADALTQVGSAASKGDIAGGRSNARLLVTVPFETIVERASARGRTHVGPTLDAATVRKMACDAGIHRVITGPGSSILDFGNQTRLVSENLFLALVARDQHCRWPGCTIRATWCDAHHVVEHASGGATNEQTCALFCHHHHGVAHQKGWAITGDAHEFTIHHPDGSTEISRPPAQPAPPPPVPALRADSIGGNASVAPARSVDQLTLV